MSQSHDGTHQCCPGTGDVLPVAQPQMWRQRRDPKTEMGGGKI